jgi:hypothetical protein
MTELKLKRGQKRCDGCGITCGARTRVCKECGHKFVIVKGRGTSGKKYQIADWKQLVKGDRIRCKQGSGPYFINSAEERMYMTERGTYQVLTTSPEGIQAWGPSGFTFLYMGKEKPSKHLPSYMVSPHRITYSKEHFSR